MVRGLPMAEGKKLHGSDAAWDVLGTAGEHASDINISTLLRHTAAPSAAGNIMRDDGAKWVSVAANAWVPFAPTARGDMISASATSVWQRLAVGGRHCGADVHFPSDRWCGSCQCIGLNEWAIAFRDDGGAAG